MTTVISATPANFNKNPAVHSQVTNLDFDIFNEAKVTALIVTYITIRGISPFARNYLNDKINEKIIRRGKKH